MTKIKNAALAALFGAVVLGAPSLAMAQMRSADAGWYVGAHVGQADVDEINDKDMSFKILGGYKVNQNWAVELGYIDFGKTSTSGVNFKANAIELVGVGSFPVANRVSLYGKLGFARGEVKASGPGGSAKEDSVEVTYGAGVQYDLSPVLGLRGEWQRYADVGDGASDIDVLSIGIVYRFK